MKEPKLEEFGLTPSVYSDFFSKKKEIDNEREQLNRFIENIDNNPFLGFLYGVLVYGYIGLFIYFGILIEPYVGGWVWLLCFAVPYSFIFLEEKKPESVIANIISFGKYKKTKERIKRLDILFENLKKSIESRVKNFEEAFYDYYENLLDNFYNTKLYRKRSGTEVFEESLSDFDSILTSLDEANKVLVTKNFYLWEYKNYLSSRISRHNFQKSKGVNKDFLPLAEFIKKTESRPLIEKETLPPEVIYRVPRKIDWDEAARGRRLTGATGEEIVFILEKEYLCSLGREDLAEKVEHTAKERGDGVGYDILSFFSDGREKYIEVKATKNSLSSPYYISRNELGFLRDNSDTSFVYRVLISENSPERHHLEALTAEDILQESEIIPVNYMVKKK